MHPLVVQSILNIDVLQFMNCSFLSNFANRNGAIYIQEIMNAKSFFRDNIFQGNNASGMGGAIYSENYKYTVTVLLSGYSNSAEEYTSMIIFRILV